VSNLLNSAAAPSRINREFPFPPYPVFVCHPAEFSVESLDAPVPR
jgi:hypothetical protein